MGAPREIHDLVTRFNGDYESYLSPQYNETQLRREFNDPFFQSLGWDVSNSEGKSVSYKDVVHEDSIKIGKTRKSPDYAFRLGGQRKFFVETKAPHKRLDRDREASYQLRRYGWSAKLPLCILTDFEEFVVYDTRVRPNKADSVRKARVLYIKHDEYLDRWGEIEKLFSRDSVRSGSLSSFAEQSKTPQGTLEVDASFLQEIEKWRELLAKRIAQLNVDIGLRALNSSVQSIIDRIIFLRICEDRGIEPYGKLKNVLTDRSTADSFYEKLVRQFHDADEKYNSGLFHFRSEPGRSEVPDKVTVNLKLDDECVKEIIENLYYPDSPYEFSVFPPDILGHVYEQFLGRIIRFTPSNSVTVELKPEVRKSGGVYYTPTYVIDYIVLHTVGQLLDEANSAKKAAQVTILDPACGSGSFLLGAYQQLLDWHLTYYQSDGVDKHSKGRNPKIFNSSDDEWCLTVDERKRILLNSIFGVDIDPQAVEVTKLSLLLKVLEGSNAENLENYRSLFQKRALPDLDRNIKCGNSLVESDYYDSLSEKPIFDEDFELRLNVFDYAREFTNVFQSGGVSAVIGNPPYLSYSGRQAIELEPPIRAYYENKFQKSSWLSSHGLFIQKALDLSTRMVGFIVPDQVGHLDGYEQIRKVVTDKSSLSRVRYWGEEVFAGVVTPALTFITDTAHTGATEIQDFDHPPTKRLIREGNPWISPSENDELIEKLREQSLWDPKLFADPGVHTGNCARKLILNVDDATPDSVPVLEGKQVHRYSCQTPTKVLRLNYVSRGNEYFTIRPIEKYQQSEFVIRQTASYPIVGPRRNAVYFRNSLLALYPPPHGGL